MMGVGGKEAEVGVARQLEVLVEAGVEEVQAVQGCSHVTPLLQGPAGAGAGAGAGEGAGAGAGAPSVTCVRRCRIQGSSSCYSPPALTLL